MKYRALHSWDVTSEEAVKLQIELRSLLTLECDRERFNTVAGIDVAFDSNQNKAFAAIVVLESATLRTIEIATAITEIKFPYIPGLLSFREAPTIIEAWKTLKTRPDCIICDAHGIAHPRGFSITCHLGMIFDVPAIGCAKSLLVGAYEPPAETKGSRAPLMYKGKQVGAVLRTKDKVAPVFVSPGYKIDLDKSIEVVLKSCTKYRLPEPTRLADMYAGKLKDKG
jgi:deoxyribonuclease V